MTREEVIKLIHELTKNHKEYSFIDPQLYETVYRHYEKINVLQGDVVECGVWRGGFSIFLAKLFHNKTMWAVDSYAGFQPPSGGNYQFPDELHTPEKCQLEVSLEEVKENFAKFDCLDENRIKFLKGYVNETLPPEVCPINKIALLRVDVDAYSATMEVLDYLYPKVVSGGYIIFDDIGCVFSAKKAIFDYFKKHSLTIEIYDPITDKLFRKITPDVVRPEGDGYPDGAYIIKQ